MIPGLGEITMIMSPQISWTLLSSYLSGRVVHSIFCRLWSFIISISISNLIEPHIRYFAELSFFHQCFFLLHDRLLQEGGNVLNFLSRYSLSDFILISPQDMGLVSTSSDVIFVVPIIVVLQHSDEELFTLPRHFAIGSPRDRVLSQRGF